MLRVDLKQNSDSETENSTVSPRGVEIWLVEAKKDVQYTLYPVSNNLRAQRNRYWRELNLNLNLN